MPQHKRLLEHILMRRGDANVSFMALCSLLARLGFDEPVKGGHHIFTRPDVEVILNIQPKGGKAKPYQVGQIRKAIIRHGLTLEE